MAKKNKTTQKKASFEKKIRRSMMLLILVIIISIVGNVLFMFYKIAQSIENSNAKTGNAVVQISSDTNDSQIRDKLLRLTKEKAIEANEGFQILKYTVNIIKENAEQLYENEDDYGSVKVYPPLKNNADVLSVQVTYSASVTPNDSAIQKEQGLIGNLGALLYSINDNNSRISSCYFATESGIMLQADRLAAYQFDENGKVMTFEAKERPWYMPATKTNDVYFTDAIHDADTGEYAIIGSAPVYNDGKLVGVAGAGMYLTDFESVIADAKLSESGAAFIIDNNGNLIISTDKDYAWKSNDGELVNLLKDKSELSDELSLFLSNKSDSISIINLNGKEYYISCSLLKTVGWGFVSLLPVSEVNATTLQLVDKLEEISKDTNSEMLGGLNMAVMIWVATIAVLIILITLYVRRMTARLLKPIKGLTKKVRAVDGDHLEFEWENRTGDDIDELGLSFLRMTESVKQYIKDITAITAEKERIGAELSVATKIQEDMLPIVFPAFPDREEFDVFATMKPAKEVGGDFYDFFFVDEKHIALVIADVSGKGVPAALFMVIAKTLIKNRA
ncbi:MAG: SpoIIE family protein phosphatase, partial [Clostridia bacterium]|nr:SpoIIE family protein phosphatase [Clostridia bacterium]